MPRLCMHETFVRATTTKHVATSPAGQLDHFLFSRRPERHLSAGYASDFRCKSSDTQIMFHFRVLNDWCFTRHSESG